VILLYEKALPVILVFQHRSVRVNGVILSGAVAEDTGKSLSDTAYSI